MRAKGILFFFIVAFGWSCYNPTEQYSQALIILDQAGCYGPCPVYVMQIEGNGQAYLHNKQHVEPIGKLVATIPADSIEAIFATFQKTDWSSFANEYDEQVPDIPTTTLTWYNSGYKKEIRIVTKHPEELDVLIKRLEALSKTLKWQAAKP